MGMPGSIYFPRIQNIQKLYTVRIFSQIKYRIYTHTAAAMIALSINQAQAVHWWYLATIFSFSPSPPSFGEPIMILPIWLWHLSFSDILSTALEWPKFKFSTFNLNFKCASSTSLLVLVFPPPPPNKQSVCFTSFQIANITLSHSTDWGIRGRSPISGSDKRGPSKKCRPQKGLDWLWRCMICVFVGAEILRQTSK